MNIFDDKILLLYISWDFLEILHSLETLVRTLKIELISYSYAQKECISFL